MLIQQFGIKQIKSLLATPFNATTIEMVVPATDSNPIYINDIVSTVSNSDSDGSNFGIEYCTRASIGGFIRGVVSSIKPLHDAENIVYRKENTYRLVRICQDPFLLCIAIVNEPILDTDVNRYINIDAGGGNSVTGVSSVALDYVTINDISGQFKITKILQTTETNSIVECIIQKHELLQGLAVSSDLWTQVGNTLSPTYSNSNINMGTGEIIAGSGYITGNLEVDGIVDPKAVVYQPQATVPITDDGTMYYDGAKFNVKIGSTWYSFLTNENVVTYSTTTPTNITVGGVPSGTSYTNASITTVFDQLFHTYYSPAFTSFALDQTSPLEVGASISGAHTFTWSTSNSGNVATNTVAIKDVTGAVVLGSGLSNSGSFAYSFPSAITLNSPGSYQWRISAIDTNANAFGEDLFDQWMWKSYWGTSTNTSLTSAQVLALANNQLATSATGTYSFAAGGYKYFCIPTSWTQPTQFKDHATGFAIDMQAPVVLSVTNSQSIATNYNIYRSTYILTDSVQIDVA